jgi:cob(I)alamin adenosyltransferase
MYYMFQGGGKACTSLHVARTICRRAERCVVPLVRNGEVDKEAQVYLNRLVSLYPFYDPVPPLQIIYYIWYDNYIKL